MSPVLDTGAKNNKNELSQANKSTRAFCGLKSGKISEKEECEVS